MQELVNNSNRLFNKKMAVILLTGAGITLCTLAMSTLDHFTIQGFRYLGLFLVAFAFYLFAVIYFYNRHETTWKLHLTLFFVFALFQRAPLWRSNPTLSNDVWRYLWDGRLMTLGVNPYAEPVNSRMLDSFDSPLRARVDHDWMASPYPPFTQLVFAGIYNLAPDNPTAMQIVFTGFDLATGVALVLFLQRLKIPTGRLVLYLWNPLIIVEFAHGAHVDSLMTLLVVLTLYFYYTDRQTMSVISLALATLTKFIPVLLIPVFLRRWGGRGMLLFLAIISLGILPFLGAGLGLLGELNGRGIFGAVRIYNTIWKTNDGIFYWLSRALDPSTQDPIGLARIVNLLLLGFMGLWVFNVVRTKALESERVHSITLCALLFSVYLLLSPVVFPWYLTTLLALLPLIQLQKPQAVKLFTIGWLYFSAAVNFSYLFYLDPLNPREIEWVRFVEYFPLWLALLGALLVYRRAKVTPDRDPHPISYTD